MRSNLLFMAGAFALALVLTACGKSAPIESAEALADNPERLKELQAERKLQEANLGMHIREFNLTHGPEAINSIVNQMKVDPDLYFGKDRLLQNEDNGVKIN